MTVIRRDTTILYRIVFYRVIIASLTAKQII